MGHAFLLLVNPRAGSGAAAAKLPALRRALESAGAAFDVVLTEAPRDATRIVREALRDGASGVAVVGGDGTLNEAVNGFFDAERAPIAQNAWFGVLPCGTGGDFRRTAGIDRRVDRMAAHLLAARPRPVDVGWVRFVDHGGQRVDRAFLNIASFGLSGLTVQLVNQTPKWLGGRVSFFAGTLRAMARYRRPRVRVTIDDRAPFEGRVLTVAVANGRYFGGGMHIAPRAAIDDGAFDVVRIERRAHEAVLLSAAIYRGTHVDRTGIAIERGARIVAEPLDHAVLLDIDGEQPGRLPATFEIARGALALRG